jgi:hypothetical protein
LLALLSFFNEEAEAWDEDIDAGNFLVSITYYGDRMFLADQDERDGHGVAPCCGQTAQYIHEQFFHVKRR